MKYILVAPGDVRRATNDQARVKQEVLEGPIGALDIEDEDRSADGTDTSRAVESFWVIVTQSRILSL